MTLEEATNKIILAIKYISDNTPIVWSRNELLICGRIKEALHKQFPEYDVDVEPIKDDRRRPDIVIHKLGQQDNNLVAFQVKKNPNTKDIAEDIKKIIETLFRSPYFYKYGVFISIGKLPDGLPEFDRDKISIIEVYGKIVDYVH